MAVSWTLVLSLHLFSNATRKSMYCVSGLSMHSGNISLLPALPYPSSLRVLRQSETFKVSMILLLTIVSVLLAAAPEINIPGFFARSSDIKWSYKNFKDWPKECEGKKQSPIDIPEEKAKKDSGSIGLTLTSGELKGTIKNNGHTAEVTFPSSSLELTISSTTTKYNFDRLHFHWGETANKGSEHTVSGEYFAAEMHIVCWNTNYDSFETAKGKSDGLAVLGTLFKKSDKANEALSPIVDALDQITEKDKSTEVTFDLSKIIPEKKDEFFSYSGSLTTPPCSEVVTWVIFDEHEDISEDQLQAFRNLKADDGDSLTVNIRPIQMIYERPVVHAA